MVQPGSSESVTRLGADAEVAKLAEDLLRRARAIIDEQRYEWLAEGTYAVNRHYWRAFDWLKDFEKLPL